METLDLGTLGMLLFMIVVVVILAPIVQDWRAVVQSIRDLRVFMSRPALAVGLSDDAEDDEDSADIDAETKPRNAEIPDIDAETRAAIFQSGVVEGEALAIARLVHAELVGLAAGIKVGAVAPSGDRYSKYSQRVKAKIAELTKPKFEELEKNRKPSIA